MRLRWFLTVVPALPLLTGCKTTPLPPGVERGPDGTIAYEVLIEASPPGAKIEANGEIIGETPVYLKIFGDRDGTFHDFGSDFFVIRALSLTTNQYPQVRLFGTGRWFGPEDEIPKQIYFDMNQKPPPYLPGPMVYPYPVPYYYPSPYYHYRPYYGSSFGFHFGHRYPYRHRDRGGLRSYPPR